MTFRVGQKVVCVDAHTNPPRGIGAVAGKIYTVRDIGLTVTGTPGLRVDEFELTCGRGECGEHSSLPFRDAFMRCGRFRPIVERKTDISIFTKMLTGKRVDA